MLYPAPDAPTKAVTSPFEISKLISFDLCFLLDSQDVGLSDKLKGKSVVVSGVFDKHSRKELKDLIEKHGGKNVSSISKKTTFVLAGNNVGPSKRDKAEVLGIPLISEQEFINLIN